MADRREDEVTIFGRHTIGGMQPRSSLSWLFLVLIYIQQAVFVGLIDHALRNRYWEGLAGALAGLILSLIPWYLGRRGEHPFPTAIACLWTFILTLEVWGRGFDLYDTVYGYDKIAHVLEPACITAIVLVSIVAYRLHQDLAMANWFMIAVSIAVAIASGALWEIFEFTTDQIGGCAELPTCGQYNLLDTNLDLIADAVGSVLGACGGYFYALARDDEQIERELILFAEWLAGAPAKRGRRSGKQALLPAFLVPYLQRRRAVRLGRAERSGRREQGAPGIAARERDADAP
ncbi:MAG: hypothetical protein HY329_11525 [Chloroflexi bacterium]|nr:hypothetical protein [Chloroflexota bacterium]